MKTYDKKISQLINLYLRAERRLINIISAKKVKGHVTDFYESMLKQVKLELMQLQLQSAKSSKELVNELYLEAYQNSLEALGISNIGDGFAQLHKNAIEVLSDNLINNFAEVNNQVGRRIEDSIRNIGLTDAQMKFATGQTINQLQDELVNNLIKRGIGGITDKRGRVIPFTSYAELLSRSIVAETQNTCVMNVAKEHEKDLVKMTQHNTTCPICAVYEGRVYSLTGKDERFPKLINIPGFNKGYNNIHPRCRHRITPYIEKYNDVKEDIKNSNKPFEIPKEKEESINKYLEEQKEKVRLRNEKKEYEKYRQILGEEAPKTLKEYKELKYNNSKLWEDIKIFADSKASGRIAQNATFKQWIDIVNKVNDKIVGITTPNGIKILELSHHGVERFIGDGEKRIGVSVESVSDALSNPLEIKDVKTDKLGRKSQKFVGEKATVSINPETGNIIQTNPTSSKVAEKLKRRIKDDKLE